MKTILVSILVFCSSCSYMHFPPEDYVKVIEMRANEYGYFAVIEIHHYTGWESSSYKTIRITKDQYDKLQSGDIILGKE